MKRLIILLALLISTSAIAQQPGTKLEFFNNLGVPILASTVNPFPVTIIGGSSSGGLTNTELRASAVPISISGTVPVTGTFWQNIQPVSLAINTPDITDRSARLLGHVTVDNVSLVVTGAFFQATQPVSLASIPNSSNFDVALSTRLKPSDTLTKVTTIDTITNSVAVTGTFWQVTQPVSGTFWQATQPISVVSLPLPSGASTEATLALIKAKTDNIDVALSTRAITGLTDTQLRASAVPVSGTFFQSTQPVSIASMPSTPVTGTFWQSTQPVSGPLTDTQLRASAVPVSGTFFQATQPISAASLPLPNNAAQESSGNLATIAAKDFATGAKQDTANTSVASIDSKSSLGMANSSQSKAVIFANDQRPIQMQMVAGLQQKQTIFTGRISR